MYGSASTHDLPTNAPTGLENEDSILLAAFAALTLHASLNWLPTWYRPDGKLTPDEIAHRLAEQLLNGLRN